MPLEGTLGTQRSRAVYQLLGLIYLFTIFPIVLAIGLIGGFVFMVIDVVNGLIWNRDASASSAGGLAGLAARLYRWPLDQLDYIFGTMETFRFLP